MEILNARKSVLTNYEVMKLLEEEKNAVTAAAGKRVRDKDKMLMTVVYETQKYLKTTPAAVQTQDCISKLVKLLKPYELTGAETLQIINLRPTAPTDVQLIVKEPEERFKSETAMDDLINVVTSTRPPKPIPPATPSRAT